MPERIVRRVPKLRDLKEIIQLKPGELNATKRRLSNANTIWDLRKIAQQRTPKGPFDYTDGAADSEIGLRRAREAFEDLEFQPGILRDISQVDMSTTVLGRKSALPFGLAPTGFTRMMHTLGERAVVAAAASAGIPYGLSSVGTTSIEKVAETAPNAQKWFQLYLWKNRDQSLALIENAQTAGYEALIVTVDVPTAGNRLRCLRNGMTVPPQLTLKTFADASYRVQWWFDLLTTEPFKFAFDSSGEGEIKDLVDKLYDPTVTFEDLAWLREVWDGPLIIKGIQTVADARKAMDYGADGVVVSNHGGRQLDRAPIPLHVLPDIVEAVGQRGTVMLDTGIMHGGDIIAAVALGADLALVGRAYLYGLMAGGQAGVTRAIDILAGEAERTMKLLGVSSINELNPDHVRLMSRRQLLNPQTVSGYPNRELSSV